MIARFDFLLPFEITLDPDTPLQPFKLAVGGEEVVVYPPRRAQLDRTELDGSVPVSQLAHRLAPSGDPPRSEEVRINGKAALQANLFSIDFHRTEFDRRVGGGEQLVAQAFQAMNEVLRRLRLLGRTFTLSPLELHDGPWRIHYSNDDGSALPVESGMKSGIVGSGFRWSFALVTPGFWQLASGLPPDTPERPWEELLLNAQRLLPEVGPALVMAHTALETFIRWALDSLASRASLPQGLWDWINERRKEPALDAQLDHLLVIFAGHSLKERNDLWMEYRELKTARDNFTHRGLVVGRTDPVDHLRATEIIATTFATIDWIEAFLPPELRRPRYEMVNQVLTYGRPLFGPDPES